MRGSVKSAGSSQKEFLERYDRMLLEGRDKKKYRNKGGRQTTVKTVYGEVTYQRMVYEVIEEDGTNVLYICWTKHWIWTTWV